MKGEFCDIENFTPSYRTELAIKGMNDIIEMSDYLQTIVTLTPFYQIFVGRSSFAGVGLTSSGWNATTYDWDKFSSALDAIPQIKKQRLEQIALDTQLYSTGKDRDFWTCIYNSL